MSGFIKHKTVAIPPYRTSGAANLRDFASNILSLVCDSLMDGEAGMTFVNAQGTPTDAITIDKVGTYTGTSYSVMSTQIYDESSDTYIRIWAFHGTSQGQVSCYVSDTEGASGSYDGIKMYNGNISKCIVNNTTWYYELPYDIIFGVKHGSSIGLDPGYNLNLDIPLFGFAHNRVSNSSTSRNSLSQASFYNTGAQITFIVKGSDKKTIIGKLTQEDYNNMFIYGDELLRNVDQQDPYRACVISQYTDFYNRVNFSMSNDTLGTVGFLSPGFRASSGRFSGSPTSFKRLAALGESKYVNSTATKFVYSAVYVSEVPWTYQDSGELSGNGIGIKGWVDSDVLRYAYEEVIPQSAVGTVYGGGDFVVAGKSTLIGWDASNSPFNE